MSDPNAPKIERPDNLEYFGYVPLTNTVENLLPIFNSRIREGYQLAAPIPIPPIMLAPWMFLMPPAPFPSFDPKTAIDDYMAMMAPILRNPHPVPHVDSIFRVGPLRNRRIAQTVKREPAPAPAPDVEDGATSAYRRRLERQQRWDILNKTTNHKMRVEDPVVAPIEKLFSSTLNISAKKEPEAPPEQPQQQQQQQQADFLHAFGDVDGGDVDIPLDRMNIN